jgi:hypothetical protein
MPPEPMRPRSRNSPICAGSPAWRGVVGTAEVFQATPRARTKRQVGVLGINGLRPPVARLAPDSAR